MKNSNLSVIVCGLILTFLTSASWGQILVEDGQGESVLTETPSGEATTTAPSPETKSTGEGAARKYFIERKPRSTSMSGDRQPSSVGGGSHYLAFQVGTFLSDKQYRWGSKAREEDVGETILGVSYRVGEWTNSMDLLVRAEYQSFDIDGETPRKLSIMPVITFPDVNSDFPLYFGAGGGVGIFLDQVGDESDLSFDYQAIVGGRLLNLWENGGLVVETGIKGHVHLVSSGQFSGVFLTVGGAFTF